MSSIVMENPNDHDDELPGFRFHPTDEELVGFYLRRKVENKPISMDLIKSIDIYKYDPWDLPKCISGGGDKEWYLFCKRGRKYKNSARPNRVTASGFWKATGIDKPVRSLANAAIIGLKKTLVYYRGCAGKGTKTDWMMHEFRLPTTARSTVNVEDLQEAEIWTICRIFKRSVSYRKYTSDGRELSSAKNTDTMSSNKHKRPSSSDHANSFIDFSAVPVTFHAHKKSKIMNNMESATSYNNKHVSPLSSEPIAATYDMMNMEHSSLSSVDFDDENGKLFTANYCASWDELRAVVDYALHPHLM